ncbi:MAG: hypothetical protein ACI9WO_001437 [Sphingobacteriales bacterium]|jgi:hypothetical protein
MKNIKFLIIPIILSLVACGKYDEGPSLSLRSKENRITNNWTEVERVINGTDTTIRDFCYEFGKDGVFEDYFPGPMSYALKLGTWELTDEKTNLTLNWSSRIDVYKIKRLTNKEFWLEQTTDSSFVELKWERCN